MPYPVKRATVVAWLEKFYDERGKPENAVVAGTELKVANAEHRRILSWAIEQRKRIMDRDSASSEDLLEMTRVETLIAKCETSILNAAKTKDADKQAAGESPKGLSKGILGQIAEAEKARKRGLSDDAESADDGSPEDQPQATPDHPSTPQGAGGISDPLGTSGVPWPD